jgi:Nucleoporin autopeptidase
VQPSLTQLAAMAREDPESLAHVANFTVGRPGIGSVHWLEEVDVRGVDVEALVRLSKGGVEVRAPAPLWEPAGLTCAHCSSCRKADAVQMHHWCTQQQHEPGSRLATYLLQHTLCDNTAGVPQRR